MQRHRGYKICPLTKAGHEPTLLLTMAMMNESLMTTGAAVKMGMTGVTKADNIAGLTTVMTNIRTPGCAMTVITGMIGTLTDMTGTKSAMIMETKTYMVTDMVAIPGVIENMKAAGAVAGMIDECAKSTFAHHTPVRALLPVLVVLLDCLHDVVTSAVVTSTARRCLANLLVCCHNDCTAGLLFCLVTNVDYMYVTSCAKL